MALGAARSMNSVSAAACSHSGWRALRRPMQSRRVHTKIFCSLCERYFQDLSPTIQRKALATRSSTNNLTIALTDAAPLLLPFITKIATGVNRPSATLTSRHASPMLQLTVTVGRRYQRALIVKVPLFLSKKLLELCMKEDQCEFFLFFSIRRTVRHVSHFSLLPASNLLIALGCFE